jgi:hypothetical protein
MHLLSLVKNFKELLSENQPSRLSLFATGSSSGYDIARTEYQKKRVNHELSSRKPTDGPLDHHRIESADLYYHYHISRLNIAIGINPGLFSGDALDAADQYFRPRRFYPPAV